MEPPHTPLPAGGARLLSMDGGGVKGVSGLIFLDELMKRVKAIEISRGSTNQADRKPSDYFDLAAGTSTGGLMAVMLFRLRMTVKECQDTYHSLAQDIFAPRILGIAIKSPGIIQTLAKGFLWGRSIITGFVYKPQPLLNAVDTCVQNHPLDENDKVEKGGAQLVNEKAGKM
jgi:patatin-like phospholipase/acyl hydrolase